MGVQKTVSDQQLLLMEPPPSPLSSRAQPRDLRFNGLVLEMFFYRAENHPSCAFDSGGKKNHGCYARAVH